MFQKLFNFIIRLLTAFGLSGIKAQIITWVLIIVGPGILIALVVGGFLSFCGSTPAIDQKKVDEQKKENTDQGKKEIEERVGNSANRVENISNEVQQAQENTNQAMNRDFTNSNINEANKARCLAYPFSKGCGR